MRVGEAIDHAVAGQAALIERADRPSRGSLDDVGQHVADAARERSFGEIEVSEPIHRNNAASDKTQRTKPRAASRILKPNEMRMV
ncbi:MAG: hypothetical protein QM811_11010 [Pirellulales bacterium]